MKGNTQKSLLLDALNGSFLYSLTRSADEIVFGSLLEELKRVVVDLRCETFAFLFLLRDNSDG